MIESNNEIDWSLTTWKGSRRNQHQQHLVLSLREKLRIIEEMCDRNRAFIESRKKAGLPYIDPYTGEVVRGSRD